ncbi:hypothetical protein SASPL_100872 [Salvia splendens]|uniref:HAT C-terminal dimerisation domain-containing protein n=1 Tax=Salvia splendens TaxID=180675 RepID=A0A8X8YTH9_SALSN|nr:hypothetical protein SASPL_100872 [Salvia splendens]
MTKITVAHDLPLNWVEFEHVRAYLAYLNSDVKFISRNTHASDVINLYNSEKEKLRIRLNNLSGMLCLTSDVWTACTNSGLKVACDAIEKIRGSVKYVKASEGRLMKFKECAQKFGVEFTSSLCLDVPTHAVVKSMALKMKLKFDKYWKEYSEILSIGAVLDPRMKFKVLDYFYSRIDTLTSKDKILKLKMKLYVLYDEYKKRGVGVSLFKVPQASSGSSSSQVRELDFMGEEVRGREINQALLNWEEDDFAIYKNQAGATCEAKSPLDVYLEEGQLAENGELDLLKYWRDNASRFGELSTMACDVLSIPITTVASESSFSIGAHVLNKYRNRLLPEKVQALICLRNWLRGYSNDDEDYELDANDPVDASDVIDVEELPISDSESLRSDPVVSVNESETVGQETLFDDSETPVPEAVLLFDDSNAVVPEMIRPCDESDMGARDTSTGGRRRMEDLQREIVGDIVNYPEILGESRYAYPDFVGYGFGVSKISDQYKVVRIYLDSVIVQGNNGSFSGDGRAELREGESDAFVVGQEKKAESEEKQKSFSDGPDQRRLLRGRFDEDDVLRVQECREAEGLLYGATRAALCKAQRDETRATDGRGGHPVSASVSTAPFITGLEPLSAVSAPLNAPALAFEHILASIARVEARLDAEGRQPVSAPPRSRPDPDPPYDGTSGWRRGSMNQHPIYTAAVSTTTLPPLGFAGPSTNRGPQRSASLEISPWASPGYGGAPNRSSQPSAWDYPTYRQEGRTGVQQSAWDIPSGERDVGQYSDLMRYDHQR